MKSVLVTGDQGFIGKAVVSRLLRHGYTVFGYDREPGNSTCCDAYSCCVGDVLDYDRLLRVVSVAQPNAIIHLAARTDLAGSTLQDYAENTEGVRNVCEAIRTTKCVHRAVFTSSQLVCEVGYSPKTDDDHRPNTVYGQSKAAGEQIVREDDGGGAVWCIVRPTTVWGPGMSPHYQRLLGHIKRGTYFHCGCGPGWKSYGFIGNVAYQYSRLLVAKPADISRQTFYLADYKPMSLRAYTNRIAEELKAKPIRTVPIPLARCLAMLGDIFGRLGWSNFPFDSFRLKNILTEYQFDMQKTNSVCGDLPYSFDDGICALIEWFVGCREHEATR